MLSSLGVFGGSILAPMQQVPSSDSGLRFVPSFGLGTLLISPLVTVPYMLFSKQRGNGAVRSALLPGLAAGAMWNGANVCSIYAIGYIGFSVAGPMMQCAIIVAATWGVLVFKEMKGRQVIVMTCTAAIVLIGAVLLALAKVL